MIKSICILSTFFISLVAFSNSYRINSEVEQEKNIKPNIIYILADDMGVHDLGCYGQKLIKTPHIDKMASEGMRFTQHYAGSTVCAPSRGALMTGLHTGHGYVKGNFAMENEGNLPLPEATVTVAELMQKAGYKTGIIGKWGLGGPHDHGHPNKQGFDYSYCYLDQRLAHDYYPDHLWNNYEKINLNEKYSHDIFANEALHFIVRNQENPFFLYLPFTIPHGKFQVPDDSPYTNKDWSTMQKNYAAMITRMDKDIGRIFSLLDSLDLDENTIVFFSSDNGGIKGMSDFFKSNGLLKGYKTDIYEAGIRAPLIARWPGKIEKETNSDHISAFWDMLPTFCEIAEVPVPANIDGISLMPTLINEAQKKHNFLVWEYFSYNYGWKEGTQKPRNQVESIAVRMGDFKGLRKELKKNPEATIELYDLSTDPGEHNNIADQFPEVVKKIHNIMEKQHKNSEFFTR